MKYTLIVCMFFCFLNSGCSQNFGPGYSFELFKNTPNWDLAKAVQNEDEREIKRLVKENGVDINLQESKFGKTLLLLAIGNDKLLSTKILLEEGANINIADSEMAKPIHEATRFITLKVNSLQILKLLIKFGANVNDTSIIIKGNDTISFYVPLIGASKNLECGKLLIESGANPYVMNGNAFLIWRFFDGGKHDENIFFAKYLIVDKKMAIPNPIDYSLPNNIPVNIFDFLKKENFGSDFRKEKARNEILQYLHEINFPINHVYDPNKSGNG